MSEPPTFLLVDDNAFDVRLLRSCFERSPVAPQLRVIDDGQLAMDHVQAVAEGREPVPDLVILDLNLPKRSGFEVLARMHEIVALREVPVIVLSTSRSPDDEELAQRLNARYLRKPTNLDGYDEVVAEIERHWAERGGA